MTIAPPRVAPVDVAREAAEEEGAEDVRCCTGVAAFLVRVTERLAMLVVRLDTPEMSDITLERSSREDGDDSEVTVGLPGWGDDDED